ncbi:hypothetical protein [Sphingosinicella humi]|nr:hypothetical protein [Sphingosinicella humi]
MKNQIALLAAASVVLSGCATTYSMTPITSASQTVRYDRGSPTTDFEKEFGAIQVTPVQVADDGKLVFAVAAFNKAETPSNFGVENISLETAEGEAIRVFTHDELVRQAKNKAMWASIATAMAGGLAAYAANQNAYRTTNANLYTPSGGVYHYTARTYDPAAAVVGTAAATAAAGAGIYAIQRTLDNTIANLGDRVLQTTTIDPGEAFGGQVVANELEGANYPRDVILTITWNGEEFPFRFRIDKVK